MTAVLATPPFLYFADSNGNPLSGGYVYTYAAGTDTPKATYTDDTGNTEMPNPIELDDAGRATWWLIGSYKYVIKDALGNTITTTDNVTAFSTLAEQNDAFFQTFSGNGTQTAFTLSEDLGTEEKALMIFVNSGLQANIANGNFATDTIWTKGAGWTIGAGVATAAGAISTAISQTATVSLVAGQAYSVTYTITRSAGGLIPSIGGQNGTERTASGTYREVIVAGSSQTIAFTGNAFTGTLDDVVISVADSAGYDIIAPTAYTLNGTALTFATAPATGTNNIYVFAPSLLLGAASAAAAAAEASATAALTSETNAAASATAAAASAVSAAGFAQSKNQWVFSSTTTMSDPGTGNLRFNAAVASTTAIAISNLAGNIGNPDLSAWTGSFDDSSNPIKGTLYIFKDQNNFAFFNITGSTTSSAGWNQLAVAYLTSAGTISNTDNIYLGFAAAGDQGATGPGTGDVIGPISATDNAFSRFNNSGTVIQNSGVICDDSNNVSGMNALNVGASSFSTTTQGNFALVGASPIQHWYENDAAADSKLWRLLVNAASWSLRTRTDLDGNGTTAYNIDRSGTNVTGQTWNNNSGYYNFNGGTGIRVDSATAAAVPAAGDLNAKRLLVNGAIVTPFLGNYTSGQTAYTNAGTFTLTHGLGGVPNLIQARLVCTTADAGYSVNDVVVAPLGGANGADYGYSAVITSTSIIVRISTNGLTLPNSGTGAATALTAANWRFIFKAWI